MQPIHLLPALALGLTLALPAQACSDCEPATPANAVPAPDAMVVVRDAETGRLRAATAAEIQALTSKRSATNAQAMRQLPTAVPLLRRHAGGAMSARMTPEYASYSVVVRQADGTLLQRCAVGSEAAQAAMLPPMAHSFRPSLSQAETE